MTSKKGNRRRREEELTELVEDALLRRATGYEDASGKPVPPDIRAAIYWLENRCPDRWKRNRRLEQEDQPVPLDPDEEDL